jgi:hypothetical protein
MPLFPTNPNNITGVTNRSVMYVNPTTSVNMTYGIVGLSGEDIASNGFLYNKTIKPFATGWPAIDATGRYVFASESGHHGQPVESVLIYNPGPTAIRVGYNIPTSGDWSNETGFPLGSGDSIQFGGVDIGTVRNAWAKTLGGTAGNSGTAQIIYIQTYPKDTWV